MPRSRYRFTEEDVPVVHRWVHAKLRNATWLQHEEARTTWDQFPREQPTATQLQAVIRAARRTAYHTCAARARTVLSCL